MKVVINMLSNRVLEYYLESDYFYVAIRELIEQFSGTCEKQKLKFSYETDISLMLQSLKNKNSYYVILNKYDVEHYFNKSYENLQLSTILWSILLGKSKDEISVIANKRYAMYSLFILKNLLCGVSVSEIEHTLSTDKQKILNYIYKGTYYVSTIPVDLSKDCQTLHTETKIKATYSEEERCLIDIAGNKYTFKY